MKQKLKFISLIILTILLLLPTAVPIQSADVIGAVLSTDIRAYINGAEIPTYNISGKLAVIVSDLNNHGFKTEYHNDLRKTTVSRDLNASENKSSTIARDDHPVGTPLMPVYSSDITVELDGRSVEAFNVDNRMAIYFADLSDYGNYWFDNNSRASYLILKDSIPTVSKSSVSEPLVTSTVQTVDASNTRTLVADTNKAAETQSAINTTDSSLAKTAETPKTKETQKTTETKQSENKTQDTPNKEPRTFHYVLNKNTKKFHYPGCSSVKQMKDSNKKYFSGTRKEAIAMGYVPCKKCNP